MSLLLETTSWADQLSDFITAKWGELLGIFGGTTFIGVLLYLVSRLIIIAVQAKVDKKKDTPVIQRFKELENQFILLKENLFTTLKEFFGEQMQGYIAEFEKKFDEKFAEFQAKKQEIVNSIVSGRTEIAELIKQGEQKVEEINQIIEETKAEIEEKVPEIEEKIVEDEEPIVEETPQPTKKMKKTYENPNKV